MLLCALSLAMPMSCTQESVAENTGTIPAVSNQYVQTKGVNKRFDSRDTGRKQNEDNDRSTAYFQEKKHGMDASSR